MFKLMSVLNIKCYSHQGLCKIHKVGTDLEKLHCSKVLFINQINVDFFYVCTFLLQADNIKRK